MSLSQIQQNIQPQLIETTTTIKDLQFTTGQSGTKLPREDTKTAETQHVRKTQ